jgi:transcriptional regulator
MKCTIKQLAEELNLSRNTVAKALKNSNEVSSKTKQRVLNKARELNYNNINKELFSESGDVTSPSNVNNGSILFLTKTYAPDSEFWTAVLTGIESILSNAHYHLVIGIMSESDLKKMDFPTALKDPSIKGIILVEICDGAICNALLQYNLPIITVDLPKDYNPVLDMIDIVTMENKKNIHRIVNYLISKGAERFAFVGDIYSANVGRGFQERFDALQECLSDNHLELDRKHCLLTETSDEFQDFQTVVKKLQKMASVPDVFICGNDRTAIQLIYALQFLGYQIPKDVSVVGFDGIPASERITPSLTTIQTPKKYLGIAAARQMLERIQYPNSPHSYMEYETKLIIRDSTI